MQPWLCCTQQRSVLMIRRHCEGEQHMAPEVPAVQVSPARVQSLQTPPEHELPAQQSESALHDWPRGRHAQRPATQVIEPQQSAAVAHVAFEAAQAQRPPMQAAPLQHSAPDAQAPPARLQQVPAVPLAVPLLHEIDAPPLDGQQRVPVAPDEHAAPGEAHMVPAPPSAPPGIEQVPLRHSRPAEQSAFEVHAPPAVLRAQRPLRHERAPQHSLSVVQVPISARQQRFDPWAVEHMVPVTHMGVAPGVQAAPAGTGVLTPSLQVPLVQVRPEQHALIAEQAVRAPLHRWQRPPMH